MLDPIADCAVHRCSNLSGAFKRIALCSLTTPTHPPVRPALARGPSRFCDSGWPRAMGDWSVGPSPSVGLCCRAAQRSAADCWGVANESSRPAADVRGWLLPARPTVICAPAFTQWRGLPSQVSVRTSRRSSSTKARSNAMDLARLVALGFRRAHAPKCECVEHRQG
jgi:hypothetical protein